MYIKRICYNHVGPIEKIDISLLKNEDGTPKPIVFVGENGTGKSTVLSNIVDSFYEMASVAFTNAMQRSEGSDYQYYKAINNTEIQIGHDFMVSYIEFENIGEVNEGWQYLYKSGVLSKNDFEKEFKVTLKEKVAWKENENFKNFEISKSDVETFFNKSIFCYFGADRFEKPIWLGNKYYDFNDVEFEIKNYSSGILYNPINVKNVTSDTLTWLLDVIADSRVDIDSDSDGKNIGYTNNTNIQDKLLLGKARKNIEQVMSAILQKEIYFGLNYRSTKNKRFNIREKGTNKIIVPTLDSLSTGQSALFNIFATIIRYADNININSSFNIEDIEGIVVIDEIDLHLHINIQSKILPNLLKMFPKIQFIFTTHSPLLLLGLDGAYSNDGYCIYQMPDATMISSEDFTEFENAYKYMADTQRHRAEIQNAIESTESKALIITEGATDWRHLKAALKFFRNHSTEPKYTDLDIEFLEYNSTELTMSASHLLTMCKEYSKLHQKTRLIFIADADVADIVKKLSENSYKYKNWKNNVYSFILPLPNHRKNTPEISIEHYYSDEDIKRHIDIAGIKRRLYIGNEFDNYGNSLQGNLQCLDEKKCGKDKISIIDGQSDSIVIDRNEQKENKTNIALPKMKFAEAIYNETDEMKDIDFSAFHLVFDIIQEIQELPN